MVNKVYVHYLDYRYTYFYSGAVNIIIMLIESLPVRGPKTLADPHLIDSSGFCIKTYTYRVGSESSDLLNNWSPVTASEGSNIEFRFTVDRCTVQNFMRTSGSCKI